MNVYITYESLSRPNAEMPHIVPVDVSNESMKFNH
jgi:hypothetical protein